MKRPGRRRRRVVDVDRPPIHPSFAHLLKPDSTPDFVQRLADMSKLRWDAEANTQGRRNVLRRPA